MEVEFRCPYCQTLFLNHLSIPREASFTHSNPERHPTGVIVSFVDDEKYADFCDEPCLRWVFRHMRVHEEEGIRDADRLNFAYILYVECKYCEAEVGYVLITWKIIPQIGFMTREVDFRLEAYR